jgi:hypothetical protein
MKASGNLHAAAALQLGKEAMVPIQQECGEGLRVNEKIPFACQELSHPAQNIITISADISHITQVP